MADPAELDDSNSFVDFTQPDRRIPYQLNVRKVARATSAELDVDFDKLEREASTDGR